MHRFSPFQMMQSGSVDRNQNATPDQTRPNPTQLETPVADEPNRVNPPTKQIAPEKQATNEQEAASKTSPARTGDLPADRTTYR